jgi:hypothetical protein
VRVVLVVVCLSLLGCAVGTQMLAAPDDLADYRAYRVARREGDRLARAQAYLKRHPVGAWANEVRIVFDAEEAAWFESAKASRSRARDYLVDLPDGPHVEAARALLLLFDEHKDDIDTLELLAASRRTAAMLDAESERRRRVGEVVLEELSALLDGETWGARFDAPPPALAGALCGPVPRTWGAGPLGRREDELFFVVPTPDGAQARALTLRFQLLFSRGRVFEGRIEGQDLFIRWAEAISVRVLDPNAEEDRRVASAAVADVLAGALEGRMPASRCAAPLQEREVLARGCDGWGASVVMGSREGDDDVVAVRGPQPSRARATGMR